MIQDMFQLGKTITDNSTGQRGMLTHMQIEMGNILFYRFQPRGLKKDERTPVDATWLVPARIKGGQIVPSPELPMEVLGTEAEDEASGYKGTCVNIVVHLNGCLHISIQSKEKTEQGNTVPACEFDIRRLSGKAIKKFTERELKQSIEEVPGPMPVQTYSPATPTSIRR